MNGRRGFLLAIAGLGIASALGVSSQMAQAREAAIFTGIVKGVAVGGYDPVAYFTQGKPVKGRADITLDHGGATWRFASAESRDAFRAEPEKYAPQFGGYCSWAVSQGYTAKGDPEAWSIVGGKLYLNYDKNVRRTWLKDAPGNIAKGEKNWPKVLG